MKQFIILPLGLFLFSALSAQNRTKLRGVHFQMTKVEVQNLEKRTPLSDNGSELIYSDFLFGKTTKVHYLFEAERLFGFYYKVKLRKVESDAYANEILQALKKKYSNHKMAFAVHSFTEKNMQVNLSVDNRFDSVQLLLVYTDRPLSSIDSPLLASVREQWKQLVDESKQVDIREKI